MHGNEAAVNFDLIQTLLFLECKLSIIMLNSLRSLSKQSQLQSTHSGVKGLAAFHTAVPTRVPEITVDSRITRTFLQKTFYNVPSANVWWYPFQGYYARSDDYFPILTRERKGCFEVPMIHSTYLIDLRRNISSELCYNPPHPDYIGEYDDILVYAHSAKMAGLEAFIYIDRLIYMMTWQVFEIL